MDQTPSKSAEAAPARQRKIVPALVLFLALFVAFGASACPKPLPVRIALVPSSGDFALTAADREFVLSKSRAALLAAGIDAKFEVARLAPDLAPTLRTLETLGRYFGRWHDALHDRFIRSDPDIRGGLAAPATSNGSYWTGGLSQGRDLVVFGGVYDERRRLILLERYEIAALHEIGHRLGAKHEGSGATIMHPDALVYANGQFQLTFSLKSIHQMGGCKR